MKHLLGTRTFLIGDRTGTERRDRCGLHSKRRRPEKNKKFALVFSRCRREALSRKEPRWICLEFSPKTNKRSGVGQPFAALPSPDRFSINSQSGREICLRKVSTQALDALPDRNQVYLNWHLNTP